jgi:hypothetical protein
VILVKVQVKADLVSPVSGSFTISNNAPGQPELQKNTSLQFLWALWLRRSISYCFTIILGCKSETQYKSCNNLTPKPRGALQQSFTDGPANLLPFLG